MRINSITAAKSQLSYLIEVASNGEEVVISRAGKPVVKLVMYQEEPKTRIPGGWEGRVEVTPDFDDTTQELVTAFYENPINPSA